MIEVNIKKRRVFSQDVRRKLSVSHGGTGILKEELEIRLCECGCGNYAKQGNKFIVGHNRQGEKQSNEEKQKRAISLSKSWANDFKRKKEQSNRMSGDNNPAKRPEVRKKISNKTKGVKYSKEKIEQMRIIGKKNWDRPEYREKMLKARRKVWDDPAYQEKMKISMQKVYSNPEVRKKIGKASRRLWKTQEFIDKHSGANNFNWRGGISGEPQYVKDWTDSLKEAIRERDNYICQICLSPQEEQNRKLHIHHIDYDKTNCNPDNLISLCHSCHVKTNNKDRGKWKKLFTNKMKVIKAA